jgi:hypothetical protein
MAALAFCDSPQELTMVRHNRLHITAPIGLPLRSGIPEWVSTSLLTEVTTALACGEHDIESKKRPHNISNFSLIASSNVRQVFNRSISFCAQKSCLP